MTADAREYVKGFFQRALFRLNDSYAITRWTVLSLPAFLKGFDDARFIGVDVKDPKGPWFFERPMSKVREMIRHQIDTGQYERSLVFIISEVEDFISSVIRVILTADPEELTHGPNEGGSMTTVELSAIVKAKDLESLLRDQIEFRIDRIMREPARTFLTYLAMRLGGSPKKKKYEGLRDAIERYCEISATRDMIVHTGRKATFDYMDKAKSHHRVKVGEVLPVDEGYFGESVAHIRDLYAQFESAMIGLQDDEAILRALMTLGLDTPYDPQHSVLPDRPPVRSASARPIPLSDHIGVVLHYIKDQSVALLKLDSGTLRVGDKIRVLGETTDFSQRVDSLQVNHVSKTEVGPNDEIGLKVDEPASKNDAIYKVPS
jgi:hypothetical protein